MTWSDRQWTFDFAYGLDRFGAAVFFLQTGMSISAMCWLVKQGKADQLKLRPWQISFLRWLEPKLSAAHCEWAAKDDLARVQTALKLLTPGDTP
jgi:hypothetical protein